MKVDAAGMNRLKKARRKKCVRERDEDEDKNDDGDDYSHEDG